MTEPFKTILVGCGGISRAWLEPTVNHPLVQYVGLVDLDLYQAHNRQQEYQLTHAAVGDDLAEMLTQIEADVVFDCTIPEAHTLVTVTALQHGCHVLGEKPMAASMALAEQMLAAAEASGKLYAVMQNRRYLDGVIRLKEFVQSGIIGPLTTLNADFYIGAHFGGFRDEMDHVLLLDMAIHSFDQARFISATDPLSVYCHEWNPAGSWYHHGASAMAIFEMTSEVIFNYRGSWASEGLRTPWECAWRAVGTKGSVSWDGHETFTAEIITNDEGFHRKTERIEAPVPVPLVQSGHAGLIHDFFDCLQNGRVPQTVCTDNINSLAMVHSAIASADSGKKIIL